MKNYITTVLLFLSVATFWSTLSSQTITNPRSPAEFEEVKGVLLRWDEKEYYKIFLSVQSSGWTSYLSDRYYSTMNSQTTIIKEGLNEGLEVYVIDDTSRTGKYGPWLYSDYHVLDTLIKLGVPNSSHLHIIPYPKLDDNLEKVWIRDWGEYNIYSNGVGSMSLAGRSLDTTIAKYLQKPFITTSVMDGGNFLTDGHGRLVADQNQTYIDQTLFGINDLITVANYKIHVDYYMKLINEETFIVNDIPASNHGPSDSFYGDSTVLEGAIAVMKQRTSCFGRPYKFVRIKTAPTYNQNGLTYITSEAGYANSLILNRTVLVPTYNNPATDTVAINTYKRVMPGYRIIGVPSRYYAARQGAAHCITKELAADNPIFIVHAWLPDTTSNSGGSYQIKAYIKTPPGVSHAEVNWTTNPLNGFQSISMTQAIGDTFIASIPGQSSGNVLSYYISATAIGGKQVVKPVVAPGGYYSTYLKPPTGTCTITCPANISVSNTVGQCGATVNYPAPITTGSCGTVTSIPASGTFFPIGTTTVNCSVASGPSCSFTVTVVDTQKPTIACASNINVPENPPGSGSAIVNYAAPTVSDNCPGTIVTSLPASGSSFLVGTTTVKCKVTDASGNKDSCSFTVTVTGCQITCPANISVPNTAGQCGAIVNYPAPITTGPCGSVTSTPPSGTFFPIGVTTVTCSVASGPSCTFTVTVVDTQKPTIACPSNINVPESSPGSGSAIVNYAAPTVSDNCPGTIVTSLPASGSSFLVGITTVKCKVTDASGNKDSCSFTVTVTGCQITCPGNISVSNTASQCGAIVNYPAPVTTGPCGSVTSTPPSGTFFPIGTTTVNCSVASGPSCSFTVTVADTQKPTIACASNIIIQESSPGSGFAAVNYAAPIVSDNCPSTIVTSLPASGSNFAVGTTTVKCKVTDASGNKDSCSFTVTVNGVAPLGIPLAVRDDFNRTATVDLSTSPAPYKWVKLTNQANASSSMQINADGTISPINTGSSSGFGGVAWDSLMTDTSQIGLIVKQKGGNGNNSTFFMYFRMSGKNFTAASGYRMEYFDNPSGTDIISLERISVGAPSTLTTLNREISVGDTLVVKVEANKTMKAFVYGSNGIRDSISSVDNTNNPSQWYCWLRGYVFPTPVKLDNFMIGKLNQTAPGVPGFSVAPGSISFGTVAVGSNKKDSVTVTNTGTASLVISSVSSGNGQFTVTPPSATINPGLSNKFYITFTPANTTPASGNITFNHNAAGSPNNVSVNGTGGVPIFGVSLLTLSYGDIIIGLNTRDSVVVSNSGTVTLNISSVISDSIQFSVTPSSGSIAPSGSQKFYITFTPTSTGIKSGDIIFTHNASGSPNIVTLSGNGIVSPFAVAPTSLSFGNVPVGSSKPDSLIVSNNGAGTLTIISATTDNGQFIMTPSSGTISPSATMTFYVTFTPTSSGNKTGNVIFNHSAPGSPNSVPVSSTGIAPVFSVAPASVAFGNVALGSAKQDSVTVTNTGTATLLISSASADSAQFTVAPSNASIAPSGSQKLYITFTPGAAGTVSGHVNFVHNAAGSPGNITVSGTGVTAGFSVTPSALTFGNVNVGSNKKDSLTVTNTGTSLLTISSVASDNVQFTVTPASGSLSASASQKFYVTYTPASSTVQSGNILFTYNASGSPSAVPVSGTGVAPVFSVNPISIAFGNVTIGSNKQDSATVTNTGTASLIISTVASNNGQFTFSPAGSTIAPTASQKFYVTFTPTASGLQSGNISFTHNATGSPSTVAVNGTGVQSSTPVITSFTPVSGPVGTSITINGSNFNPIPSGNIVYFGAVKAIVTNATVSTLTVTVPFGATYFPITVETNGLVAYSILPFVVTFPSTNVIDASSFAPRVDFAAGNQPFGVSVGDVDGDGKPDIQAANISTVSVMRNTSTLGNISAGSFAPQVVFNAGSDAYIPFMGDVDGDGKLDLLVTNNLANTISIFRNISSTGSITTGSFAASVDLATGSGPQGVYVRDVDGDGKADIIVANNASNTVSIWRNVGSPGSITVGSFAVRVDFTTATTPRFIEMGDVDGDGKPDIVTPNLGSNNVSVLRNTSTPGSLTASSFAAHVEFATGNGPKSCMLGDLDGDGKPDLAVAHFNTNTICVLRNTGTPGTISFTPHFDYVTGNAARSVVMTDVSGDGKLDLEVVNQTSGTLSIMRNTAVSGTINVSSFAAPVNFTTGLKPIFLAVTDFDGDGKPDVVINNADNNTVSVFKNKVASPPAGKSTAGHNDEPLVPKTFSLDQNYPNPFNPVTTIGYTLPENARVNIRLYNTLGEVIAILADGVEAAGYKHVQFDAGALPSGVYFYHLNASSTEDATRAFSQVKKMILMK